MVGCRTVGDEDLTALRPDLGCRERLDGRIVGMGQLLVG